MKLKENEIKKCKLCRGKGVIFTNNQTIICLPSNYLEIKICPKCKGTGIKIQKET